MVVVVAAVVVVLIFLMRIACKFFGPCDEARRMIEIENRISKKIKKREEGNGFIVS